MRPFASEDGVALLVAIMALLLMSAIGGALLLSSSSETLIAAHFRDNLEARAAAGAMMQRGMDDVAAAGDWTVVTSGALRSSWVDGPPSGGRTLADGSILDLPQVVNLADCEKTTACSIAEMNTVTGDRPWGSNNPQWLLYAYGPATNFRPLSSAIDSPFYVVLLVAAAVAPPGWSAMALRAEAFGPRGAHAVVEATAGRPADSGGTRLLSWRDVR